MIPTHSGKGYPSHVVMATVFFFVTSTLTMFTQDKVQVVIGTANNKDEFRVVNTYPEYCVMEDRSS